MATHISNKCQPGQECNCCSLWALTEPDPKKSDKADGASGHEAGDSGRKKRSVARKSTSKPAQVVIHDTVDITDDAEETAPVKEEEIARK